MVLLLVRAPIFGLIVTIISVLAELAFLTAALHMLAFISCRSLKDNTRFLKVRSHTIKAYAITVFAMVMFVSLESVISVFSDVALQKVRITEECFQVTGPPSTRLLSPNAFDTRPTYFRCTKVDGGVVTHMIGNSSLDSVRIACSNHIGYSYQIAKFENLTFSDEMRGYCNDNRICAMSFLEGDTLYFSTPELRRVRLDVGDTVERMVPTNVSMLHKESIDPQIISERLVQIYGDGIHMEGEVRRRLLLETTRSMCEFERAGRQATKVRGSVLVVAAAVWSLSLAALPLSLALKRRSFFDVNDPVHWAKYAWHDPHKALGKEPLLQRIDDGSDCRVRVVGYSRE